MNTKSLSQKRSLPALLAMRLLDNTWSVEGEQIRASWLATRVNQIIFGIFLQNVEGLPVKGF